MKTSSLQYQRSLKALTRELDTRVIFYNGEDKYVISGSDIQAIKHNVSANMELGDVEKKITDITLMNTNKSQRIDKGTVLYIEVWAKYENNWFSCPAEEVEVISKVDDESKGVFKITAQDKLSIKGDGRVPAVTQQKYITSINFLKKILNAMGESHAISEELKNNILTLGYINFDTLQALLQEFAISIQGLIRSDFTVIPFKAGRVVDRLKYGADLLSYTISDNNYETVVIKLFSPTEGDPETLAKYEFTLPSYSNRFKFGKVEFQSACIPQYVKFTGELSVDSYEINGASMVLYLNTSKPINQNLQAEIIGTKLTESNVSEDAGSRSKVVSNIYIQGDNNGYDTRIYTGKLITVKYTGNLLHEVGDTIVVDEKYTVLVAEISTTLDNGLRGIIKGVIVSE